MYSVQRKCGKQHWRNTGMGHEKLEVAIWVHNRVQRRRPGNKYRVINDSGVVVYPAVRGKQP